jgi:hypothetical protein
VLGQPAGGLVVRVETGLALELAAPFRRLLGAAKPQTLTSSFSFCASAMTFWATCVGTSS